MVPTPPTGRAILCALVLVSLIGTAPLYAQNNDLANGIELQRNPKFPPPTLLYSDLLNALQSHVTWSRGILQLDGTIRALFLPDCSDPHSIYAYNPDTGAKLAHQLKTPDGAVVDTRFYSGEKEKPPFWLLHPGTTPEQPLEAGAYVLEWLIEGEPFYRFSFSVEVAESDDVYNPEQRYFFEGPWSDYAYLYIANNSPTSTPTFSIWLRDKAATTPRESEEHDVNVTIKRGGEELAFWPGPGEANPVGFRPYWERQDFDVRDAGRGVFRAAEILKDGSYTVDVTVDGTLYGTYPFTVSGGAIQHQGRQVRDATDPFDYIEGDTQRFFMKRTP